MTRIITSGHSTCRPGLQNRSEPGPGGVGDPAEEQGDRDYRPAGCRMQSLIESTPCDTERHSPLHGRARLATKSPLAGSDRDLIHNAISDSQAAQTFPVGPHLTRAPQGRGTKSCPLYPGGSGAVQHLAAEIPDLEVSQ